LKLFTTIPIRTGCYLSVPPFCYAQLVVGLLSVR
jgi:hypothetical protein